MVRPLRLDSFKVIGPSIALKYLHIHKHTGPVSIEICDVNLVSFIYGGDEINLLLRNVPQLVEVSISSHRLSFGDCISQLKVLRLRGYVVSIYISGVLVLINSFCQVMLAPYPFVLFSA